MREVRRLAVEVLGGWDGADPLPALQPDRLLRVRPLRQDPRGEQEAHRRAKAVDGRLVSYAYRLR